MHYKLSFLLFEMANFSDMQATFLCDRLYHMPLHAAKTAYKLPNLRSGCVLTYCIYYTSGLKDIFKSGTTR